MNNTHTRTLGLATFGLATLGAASIAAANPAETTPQAKAAPYAYDAPDAYDDDEPYWDDAPAEPDYDLDNDGTVEHTEIDYRHYDTDRDGTLESGERAAYWNHMADMGHLGRRLTRADRARLARIAYLMDRDGDGRLTGPERATISRITRARRIFTGLDRNDDNSLSRREAGLLRYAPYDRPYRNHYRDAGTGRNDWSFYWSPFRRYDRVRPANWIAARFDILDRNDNGRVSWGEIESHFLRGLDRRY